MGVVVYSISPATPGAGLAWNINNLNINGTLSVVSTAGPKITGIAVSGTTLTINATNGPASTSYVLLESTNLLVPVSHWTPVLTNSFNSGGGFTLSTNIVNANNRAEFYILQIQ